MKQNRKLFLKQLGSGLMIAGLPGIAFADDKRPPLIDTKIFGVKALPMMKNSENALLTNTTIFLRII